MPRLDLPKISDPPEVHADWLEWQSLTAPATYVAWSDHQRDLRIGGMDESRGEEHNLEVLVNDIVAEIEGRLQACGGSEQIYPFRPTDQGLMHLARSDASTYLWLKELPLVPPLAAFFLPRRVEPGQWRRASVYGGILFDRCRISWLLPEISGPLAEQVQQWVHHVLSEEDRS